MTRPGRKRERAPMTEAAFAALAALQPSLTDRGREAARLVMVEDHSMMEAGERVGLTRQNVSLRVKRLDALLDAFELAAVDQPGWRTVTLAGPDELVNKWSAEAVEAAAAARALLVKRMPRKRPRS